MKNLARLAARSALGAAALLASGCPDDGLTRQIAQIEIIPQPTAGQTALDDPPGIDLDHVPLFGSDTALFKILNSSLGILRIDSVSLEEQSGGSFSAQLIIDGAVVSGPVDIAAQGEATLTVSFTPEADEVQGRALVALATNAGRSSNFVAHAEVLGTGQFIGSPNLEIAYNGTTYSLPDDCAGTEPDGYCRLPVLDFGNVPLETTGTTTVFLRNTPAAGECLLPDQNGAPDCSPVCTVTFDRDAAGRNIGIGFDPADTPFSITGSTSLPLSLVPPKPSCPASSDFVRGEVRLLLNYAAGAEEVDSAAAFVIESSDPDPLARRVVIPLAASARRAPVAVAQLRACDAENPPPSCSNPDEVEPLSRVYFDGSASYDPNGALPLSYAWEVVDLPPGAEETPEALQPEGEDTPYFSFFAVLAGEYRVRLRVTNTDGVQSGIGATSDVTFTAVPDSRFHVQLVWDHPLNDMDLHLVYADGDPRVYHAQYDCFWKQCHPGCTEAFPDPCDEPVHWFEEDMLWEGGNPRLDIDDTNGLGPENININRPRPGRYHVYVHYYGLVQGDEGPTQVTVRLYLDGVLRNELRRTLNIDELWAVAQINWGADDTVTVTPSNPDEAVEEVNYLPYPEGYDFGTAFE